MSIQNIFVEKYEKYQGPVVQNLTKSLTNVSLKFLSCNNTAHTLIFFAEKQCE